MSLALPEEIPAGADYPPTDNEIRTQLEIILNSPAFEAPDRARRFLSYVVEESLQGRSDRIKAFSIAMEVFGRDASFDAQNDPVVRIEAGRVRRSLERFYLLAGHDDPVIITIPKGGYVPVFTRVETAVPRARERYRKAEPLSWVRKHPYKLTLAAALVSTAILATWAGSSWLHESAIAQGPADLKPVAPLVLVEAFEDLSNTSESLMIAKGLSDEVIGQMARFKEITILTKPPPASAGGAPSGGLPLYALEGRVRVDEQKIRLSARLVDREDNSVVWSNTYDRDMRVQDLLEIEAEIARTVATAVAQPYGIIFQADAARLLQAPPNDWKAYACALSYYGYRANLERNTHAAVQACLARTVEKYPDYATAWALLSLTYLDELRFRYRLQSPSVSPIQQAAEAAQRAVEIDPANVRALEAQMLAHFFQGDVETALALGARGYAINPNDTEFAAEYGFRLALAGQWDRGCQMVSDALESNPGPLGYFEAALAICAYIKQDYPTAERWARMSDLDSNPIYHIILIAILGQRGLLGEASEERLWLEKHAPEFLKDLNGEVRMRIHRPEDQALFMDGLRKAGMNVPYPDLGISD